MIREATWCERVPWTCCLYLQRFKVFFPQDEFVNGKARPQWPGEAFSRLSATVGFITCRLCADIQIGQSHCGSASRTQANAKKRFSGFYKWSQKQSEAESEEQQHIHAGSRGVSLLADEVSSLGGVRGFIWIFWSHSYLAAIG